MKLSLVALAGVVILAAAAIASARGSAAPSTATARREMTLLRLPRATPAGQSTNYGHIASLTRKGGRWVLKFDPALVLFGVAAEEAAFEDTGSRDVPNDSYTLEEGHRLLTYVVAPTASVTVLIKGLDVAEISVAEFSQILRGMNPKHRPLFGQAKSFGFWIRVSAKYPNAVLSLDQQYHP